MFPSAPQHPRSADIPKPSSDPENRPAASTDLTAVLPRRQELVAHLHWIPKLSSSATFHAHTTAIQRGVDGLHDCNAPPSHRENVHCVSCSRTRQLAPPWQSCAKPLHLPSLMAASPFMNQKSTGLVMGSLMRHDRISSPPGSPHRAQAIRRTRAQHLGPHPAQHLGPVQAQRSGPSAGTIPWPGPHAPPDGRTATFPR